jgi:hypothetical protein
MFLKQNICRLIAIRAKFISVLIFVSTVRMLIGRQFEQMTIIISIARIQLILQLNRLRTVVDQLTIKIIIARMLSSNNKIVSSRFFEQTNFVQLIMTHSYYIFTLLWETFRFCFSLQTKIKNLEDQKWSADRTMGNTALGRKMT